MCLDTTTRTPPPPAVAEAKMHNLTGNLVNVNERVMDFTLSFHGVDKSGDKARAVAEGVPVRVCVSAQAQKDTVISNLPVPMLLF